MVRRPASGLATRPIIILLLLLVIALGAGASLYGIGALAGHAGSSSSSSSGGQVSPASTSSSVTGDSSSSLSTSAGSSGLGTGPTEQASTGVIIPLFTNITTQWTSEVKEITQIRESEPTVPILVVIDFTGGPGNYSTSTAQAIKGMQAAGITVLGYDPTWWAGRNITVVEQVMQTWQDWYHVNGIYLDQMPNWNYNGPNGTWYYPGPDGEYIPQYFSTLTQFGKSLGFAKIVANAGTDVPQDFINSVDTIGTFENAYLPSLSLTAGWTSIAGLNGWHANYSKSNFMFFAYNVSSLDPAYVLAASKYVGYMYITNGTDATDRYGVLPPYLGQLVQILAETVPSASNSSSVTSSSHVEAHPVLSPHGPVVDQDLRLVSSESKESGTSCTPSVLHLV